MGLRRRAPLKLYPYKYLRDPALWVISKHDLGVLHLLQCLMWESERPGVAVANGSAVTDALLARALRMPLEGEEGLPATVKRLTAAGFLDRELRTGALRCPSMVQQERVRLTAYLRGMLFASVGLRGLKKPAEDSEFFRRRDEVLTRLKNAKETGEEIDILEAVRYMAEASNTEFTLSRDQHEEVTVEGRDQFRLKRGRFIKLIHILEQAARASVDPVHSPKVRLPLPEDWLTVPLELRIQAQAVDDQLTDEEVDGLWEDFRTEARSKSWRYANWRKAFREYARKRKIARLELLDREQRARAGITAPAAGLHANQLTQEQTVTGKLAPSRKKTAKSPHAAEVKDYLHRFDEQQS